MTGQRAWEDKQRCKLTDIEKYHKPGIPPESEGLNSFLRGIAEAGNHESEGDFTVSLEKALDKLEKFQLTDANLFILNLVSAAVLLRATFFKVKYQPDHDLVEFDGDQLSMEELETLWVSKEPALGELSIALSAARALSYQELLFESDGGVRWQAGAKPDFFEAGSKGNSLTLVHRRSTTEKLIEKVRGTPALTPVWLRPLRKSCHYAPISIFAGHYGVNTSSLEVHSPAWFCKQTALLMPRINLVGESRAGAQRMPTNGEFSAIVGSSVNFWAKEWSLVFRGITYTRSTSAIDVGGLGGIVYSDSFVKDISHSDLIQNKSFDLIVEQLQESTVAFIRDELSLKPLPESQIREWTKAGIWAGQRLYDSGHNRDAARVEAWSYGHLSRKQTFDRKLPFDPLSRYEKPLVFLLDYLYWSGNQKIEEKIRLLSGQPTLACWLDGADTASLEVLFDYLIPLFPVEIGWEMIQPLVAWLFESDNTVDSIDKFERRFTAISPGSTITALPSVLLAASLLSEKGRLDFPKWFSRSLTTGFLPCTRRIIEILDGHAVAEEAHRAIEEFLGDEKTSALADARNAFHSYLKKPQQKHLISIKDNLRQALKNTNDASESRDLTALLVIFRADIDKPLKARFAWESHRAALIQAVRGSQVTAHKLHEMAHKKLENHWFSYLLLGDSLLAQGSEMEARQYYRRALELQPKAAEAQEAVIETSPKEERRELWLAHAASLGTHRVEDAIAYREALALSPSGENFANWVKLRALTSLAEHEAGDALPKVDANVLFQTAAVQLYFLQPVVARHLIRTVRNRWRLAGPELARLRLTHQLSRSTSAFFSWKDEFRDGEETRL